MGQWAPRHDAGPRRAPGVPAAATAEAVSQCLPLVRRLAHRLAGLAEAEDLFQAGCVGLLRAARRWDAGRGVPLAAYALPYVLGEMRALGRRQAAARGRRRQDLGDQASQLAAEGPVPVAVLAARLGLEPAELAAAERPSPAWDQSAEVPDSSGDPQAGHWIDRYDLRWAWSQLDPATRRLLAWRWVAERSQAEVGRALGISQSQASRRERAALERLRQQMADQPAAPPPPPV